MKIGIQIVHEGMKYKEIEEITLLSEKFGFDSVWVGDHFWFTDPNKQFLECWTLISSLISRTDRICIGSLVLNDNLYIPEKLAHMVTTLNAISDDRFIFGIGAGWHKKELDRLDMSFSDSGSRIRKLSNDLKKFRKLVSTPIWIGGYGNYILRICARYGDALNLARFDFSPSKTKERLSYLDKYLKKYNRKLLEKSICLTIDFAGDVKEAKMPLRNYLTKDYIRLGFKDPMSTLHFFAEKYFRFRKPASLLTGTSEQIINKLREYVDAGITYFVVRYTNVENLRRLSEEVYPEVQKW